MIIKSGPSDASVRSRELDKSEWMNGFSWSVFQPVAAIDSSAAAPVNMVIAPLSQSNRLFTLHHQRTTEGRSMRKTAVFKTFVMKTAAISKPDWLRCSKNVALT